LTETKSTAIRFGTELGERLLGIYGLARRPRNPIDFFLLLKAESAKQLGTRMFLDQVRSGRSVIGKSDIQTKDWISKGEPEKVFTHCSYDTLMTAVLRCDSVIGSACPHCGETMTVRIRKGKLEYFFPKGMVFPWGAGPVGSSGNPMCDHLHLFPDKYHMDGWIESKEGEMGFSFSLQEFVQHLRQRF
jgi:hypothetical protein